MVSLKKYVACKCGANSSFDFSSDMQIEDLTVSGRCPSCGASIHVSVSSLLSPSQPQETAPQQPTADEIERQTKENVEQAVRDLFR